MLVCRLDTIGGELSLEDPSCETLFSAVYLSERRTPGRRTFGRNSCLFDWEWCLQNGTARYKPGSGAHIQGKSVGQNVSPCTYPYHPSLQEAAPHAACIRQQPCGASIQEHQMRQLYSSPFSFHPNSGISSLRPTTHMCGSWTLLPSLAAPDLPEISASCTREKIPTRSIVSPLLAQRQMRDLLCMPKPELRKVPTHPPRRAAKSL